MARKHFILFTILALCSIGSGAVLGLLDLFGFIDGRHALSFALLILSALLLYITLITVFLLELSSNKRELTFLFIASGLFGFTFFLMNFQLTLALLASCAYAFFLTHTHTAIISRSKLFIAFQPRELFYPVLKSSFTYFLIILAILTYSQSQRLVSENALISPPMLRTVMRPSVVMLNQQINTQLSPLLASQAYTKALPLQQKATVHSVLARTVDSMKDPRSGTVYGFKPEEIPVTKASVGSNGTVDLSPMIEAMLPSIAYKLNQAIQRYAVFAPFAVALLAYLILQPIILPLHYLEAGLTHMIFKLLLHMKLIKIKEEEHTIQVPYI